MKLSLWQKIQLKLFGYVFVGYEKREGWSKAKKIYACNCPIHGLYSGPPHGWQEANPQCPKCIKDAVNRWPDILERERTKQ